MKELRDSRSIRVLLEEIAKAAAPLPSPLRIMEVCGTHTMVIHRSGLGPRLAEAGVSLLSGPGCPVCITPDGYHEAALALVTGKPNLTLATFGDMTRVPTRLGSLQTAVPAASSRLTIVYSPEEALRAARGNPDREVVFFGAGFETTIPGIAITARNAWNDGVGNFSLLPALWLIPPPLRAILEAGEVAISGFLYPGHVSAIIGTKPYEFIPKEYGIPGAVAGFEPGDILLSVLSILGQIKDGRPRVDLEYSRAVRPEGNPRALDIIKEVFEPGDAVWRGLGRIKASGLFLRKQYASLDARARYGLNVEAEGSPVRGCRCGEVLRGIIEPAECGLFAGSCNPERPVGPCMVSLEGACLIHYKYASDKGKSHAGHHS